MLQSVIVTPVLLLIGWCIWMRRHSWRMRWHRVLTLAIALQGAGFTLCLPLVGPWIGRPLFALTGVAHLRDYFGHLCFMSAAAAMVYVVASRILSDSQIERFMRRIEIPSAVAAVTMLVCMISSSPLRHPPMSADFFQVPPDGWLMTYWLIYMAACSYQLLYLINLLFVLREDPRNRFTATLLITSVRIGFVAIAVEAMHVISPGGLSAGWIWLPLCMSSGLAAFAGAWSWRRRMLRRAARSAPGPCEPG